MPSISASPRFILRCALALAGIVGAAQASAQIDPYVLYPGYRDTRIVYYDVSGSTALEVRREINARGPVGNDGGTVDALTQWMVSWNLKAVGVDRCEAELAVETSIILPRLIDQSALSYEERMAWERYILALIDHEFGHVDIARDALPELRYALENGSCEGAKARAQQVLSDANWRQIQFDRDTRHGQLTGVKFP